MNGAGLALWSIRGLLPRGAGLAERGPQLHVVKFEPRRRKRSADSKRKTSWPLDSFLSWLWFGIAGRPLLASRWLPARVNLVGCEMLPLFGTGLHPNLNAACELRPSRNPHADHGCRDWGFPPERPRALQRPNGPIRNPPVVQFVLGPCLGLPAAWGLPEGPPNLPSALALSSLLLSSM